jgi:hypothetical protein
MRDYIRERRIKMKRKNKSENNSENKLKEFEVRIKNLIDNFEAIFGVNSKEKINQWIDMGELGRKIFFNLKFFF